MRVWMDSWQLECCGDPFHVGMEVRWTCGDLDLPWLTDLLGAQLAATVTHAEEHHGDDGLPVVTGRVRSIQAVTHDTAPRPGDDPRMHYPVPGTLALTPVDASDPAFEAEGLRFAGYLIDLD